MTKLSLVSGRDMCRIVENIGFRKAHQVGSHIRYVHNDGRRTVVPVHGNEVLGRGLISEILSQVKLSRQEYERLRLEV